MAIINRVGALESEMTGWRRAIHADPETAFEEHRTASFVAERLGSFGIEVHRGIGRTGVVGVLRGGPGRGGTIGLRADMDALPLEELNRFDHRSRNPGKMHACGHDGHTAMLLGAAKYLAETGNFEGTVHFIFQPAEEGAAGAAAMIEDGLFEQFPMDAVYGMHNWPGIPVGRFAVRAGPVTAASDDFDIVVTGRGGHAAMPHLARDPILAAAHLITAIQGVASREVDPLAPVVVSVTQVHAGDAYNVIPADVVLRGTARTLNSEVRDRIEPTLTRIVDRVCAGFGAGGELTYHRGYPPTVNTDAESGRAARAAREIAGAANVDPAPDPTMGAEDFAFMLHEKPGCYVFLGNGPGEDGCRLHSPHYDFNDEALSFGASYWAKLVELELPRSPRA